MKLASSVDEIRYLIDLVGLLIKVINDFGQIINQRFLCFKITLMFYEWFQVMRIPRKNNKFYINTYNQY